MPLNKETKPFPGFQSTLNKFVGYREQTEKNIPKYHYRWITFILTYFDGRFKNNTKKEKKNRSIFFQSF